MKKLILILASIITTLHSASAQTASCAASSCSVIYSETNNTLIYQDSLLTKNTQIIIRELPPLSNDTTYINIGFIKGTYTFVKSPELLIPGDYRIYIEDLLNEKNYNLNSSEPYTFKVGRGTNDFGRFVLHIDKPVSRLNAYALR